MLLAGRGAKLLADGDTYTHITCGKWMLTHQNILDVDIYSHTVSGMPWIAHEWGAQVLMAWLYQLGGLPAVAIFFATIASLSLTVLYRILERQQAHPWMILGLMTTTLMLVYPHIYARPHLLTWLCGIVCFDLLRREGRWRWLLPLLMVPWSNLHGGFILGLALQAIFLAGRFLDNRPEIGWQASFRARREDMMILFASVAASLCNPLGMKTLLFYQTVSAIGVTRFNPEWMAPDLQAFWPFRIYLVVLLLLLFCARKRPGWVNLLLLAALLDASLAHRRHISMAAMFLLPLWLEILPEAIRKPPAKVARELPTSSWSGPVLQTGIAIALTAGLAIAPPSTHDIFSRLFPVSDRFPHQAWNWIEEHRPQGRVFNEYSWGSFLIYRTGGEIPVFIDGFADKYGEQVYGDYYRIANLEVEAEELLKKYRIGWVLFPTDSLLVRYLTETGRWDTAYSDKQACVLVLKEQPGA
jgi:hypothetical protein